MKRFAIVILLAGCTEMRDFYPDATLVDIDGREFFVVARPRNGKTIFLAGPNTENPGIFESVDFGISAQNVRAIEKVTGCRVLSETLVNIKHGGTSYAAVKC